jgi:hypothetical protein
MSAATVECRRSVTVARPPADSSCSPSATCSSDVPRDGNNCRASIADSNQGLALRAPKPWGSLMLGDIHLHDCCRTRHRLRMRHRPNETPSVAASYADALIHLQTEWTGGCGPAKRPQEWLANPALSTAAGHLINPEIASSFLSAPRPLRFPVGIAKITKIQEIRK